MSESDSFIDEVSEEVRRDRLYALLRRWGWLIALVLLLIVGGAGFVEWRKQARENAARTAGDALRGALAETDPTARAEALLEVGGGGVAARIAAAGSLAAAGDASGASEVLGAVATDDALPRVYRDLAALQRVMIAGAVLDPSERLASLERLVAPGAPFAALALEQRALVHLEGGARDAALADFEAVLNTQGATQAQIVRVQQFIIAAGGDIPQGGAGSEAPAEAEKAGPDDIAAPADG